MPGQSRRDEPLRVTEKVIYASYAPWTCWPCASRCCACWGPEPERRGISASVSGSVPVLWADPVMLEQIVHNLVTNAMQALESAATPSPAISLVLEPAPDPAQALLRVRDNGPGIAPEHLGRVFEPFFSTRAGGLGLPLCETLAQALGGSLQARNVGALGAGSTSAELVLTLPLASAAPVAHAAH